MKNDLTLNTFYRLIAGLYSEKQKLFEKEKEMLHMYDEDMTDVPRGTEVGEPTFELEDFKMWVKQSAKEKLEIIENIERFVYYQLKDAGVIQIGCYGETLEELEKRTIDFNKKKA